MSIYDFSVKTIDGNSSDLNSYRNKVLLIVNVASRCGFTPQYEELESLYRKLKTRGLEILAFPCNQFGKQEPGSNSDIQTFCETRYQISFPIFSKIEVNGPQAHPLYQFLKGEKKGLLGSEKIKWNFTKFLIDRNGKVVRRFSPFTTPKSLEPAVEALL
ncbi:MAG: glutathione peroxidase [Proteobacteria bacterium]|nr:glutathione peroxidase [Pseudomonadota bacterium]NDC24256.1 glutathione peroxidase [Pseudomonadota bacterium]NDD03701.1 glutathione peroxidase [Pseudomonadota bacterium]NDG26257.1 glutathione peroxidase [Pseudomonadota bacterium]